MTWRAAVLAAACAAAVPAGAQTAEEIVAKNVEARGGAAGWRAVTSMRATGRMEVGQGLSVPFRLELKRPRKMRLELDFDGRTAVQTFDGAAGWKLLPYLGRDAAEPLSGPELAAAAGQAELDGPLVDYQPKGHRVELVGREAVNDRDAYRLKVTLKTGAVREVYLDAETFLEAKVAATQRVRGEEKALGTLLRDYHRVAGLAIPYVLESRVEGAPASHTLTIAAVELNVALPDARFGRPAPTATEPSRRSAADGVPAATAGGAR